MTDREKVVKGLESHLHGSCIGCPYDNHVGDPGCIDRGIMTDALALLKAQEPNTRRWVKERDRTNHWRCSCCGCVQGITARVYRYCPNCGARMEVCEE